MRRRLKHLKLGTVHKGLAFWMAVGSIPAALAGVYVIELLQRSYGDDLDTLVLGMLGGTLSWSASPPCCARCSSPE